MSELEAAWDGAMSQLSESEQAVKKAIEECNSVMLIIAAERWNVKPGDVIMVKPHGKKQWAKAKVHALAEGYGWYRKHGFSQFSSQPWLQVFSINKDGTFSKKAVHAYPDCWMTIDEFEKGGDA